MPINLKRLAGRTIARFIRLVYRTSETVCEPLDTGQVLTAHHPAIIGCWHGQFMMLACRWPQGYPVKAIVARHGDAAVLAEALSILGVTLIRGAGAGARRRNRGGVHALRAAVRSLRQGASVVTTADVPPGPARRAGKGIITMARLSGRPILPVAAATSRYKAFPTWSRLTLNLPFSRLAYVVGEPLHVPPDADEIEQEACRARLERALNEATRRAYELAGTSPPWPAPYPEGAHLPPAQPGLLLRSYQRATALARPLAPLLLRRRARLGKEDARRRSERYGEASAARPSGPLVWVHAASVGETNAVLPVMESLAAARPRANFLLTTGTVTSAALAARRLGPRAVHQFAPLDVPNYIRAFLDHWQPDLAILTESEIWPNLILETSARGIPLALVNGRISKRSFARWRKVPGAALPLFSRFAVILAENEVLARRFSDLGGRAVIAAGNLKIDAPPPAACPKEAQRLSRAMAGRPMFLAASTHEGEEEIIARAHRLLAREIGGLCTVIAPRHPERGAAIAALLKAQGLCAVQRAHGALPDAGTDIYIADTIGELGTLYALSPLAFIGGSLVDKGGHNPAEAVRHGCAILTGPHWSNFDDIYRTLLRHRGAMTVKSSEDIAATVTTLHYDAAKMAQLAGNAALGLASMSGALERTLEALLVFLPEGGEVLKRAG